jgi:hypothetical protein
MLTSGGPVAELICISDCEEGGTEAAFFRNCKKCDVDGRRMYIAVRLTASYLWMRVGRKCEIDREGVSWSNLSVGRTYSFFWGAKMPLVH